MRLLLMTWLMLSGLVTVARQQPVVLSGKLPSSSLDIGPYTSFYQDRSGDTLPLSVISRRSFQRFAGKRNEQATFSDLSVMVTWLRFTIRNTHPTDTLHLLYLAGTHGLITLFAGERRIGESGIVRPSQRRPSRFAVPFRIGPDMQQTYYVRVIDYLYSPTPVVAQLLSIQGSYELDRVEQFNRTVLIAVISILTGCLLFMFLHTLYSFTLTQDRTFLYYSLYTLFCCLFALHYMDYRFDFAALFPPRMSDVIRPFHMGWIVFIYTFFVAKIIALPMHFPRTWLVLKGLLIVLVIQEFLSLLDWIYTKPIFYQNTAYVFALVPSMVISCVLLSAVIRSRSPIKLYLLTGMICMLIVFFIPNLFDLYIPDLSPLQSLFINNPYFWGILGLATEAFCFLMALSRRSQLIEVEKNRVQDQLIHQLEENQSLQQAYTADLKRQLAQRETEVLTKAHQLEEEHVNSLRADFERRTAEAEMAGLRSQMNPHFIFNCLNSIKLYATENDSEKASDYLTKFSRLIRRVMENSRSERVTLQNELEMLQLYADLEIMRFKQKLSFIIRVEPGLDAGFVEIPPLLIQPYVENAIWHGLMHKPQGGTVCVRASQPAESILQLTITDNGVGRAKAAELRSKSASHRKSFGLKMTSERIALVNQLYQTQTEVTIDDLVDADGQPAGTEVILQIPL